MAELEDRALGMAMRRRRKALGLSQRQLAESIGVPTVVIGRMELGNRPIKALELVAITQTLGLSMDELVASVKPPSPEQVVESAVIQRDAAYKSLCSYGSAITDAIAAIQDSPHGGAFIPETDDDLRDADDLVDYLHRSQPHFVGLQAPRTTTPAIRRALERLAASVPIAPTEGADD